MLLNGRFGGNVTLAWLTGVILVGISLAEGLTGYFLVWDQQAQIIARELFRALDILPIFGEPLSRSLLSQSSMSNMLFFIMLFFHIMAAIGILVFVWLHVNRVARPRLAPPKPLLYATLILTALVSVVWPAKSNLQADLDAIPTQVNLDLFYLFWVPAQQIIGPVGALTLFGIGFLVVFTLPYWLRRRATPAPIVNLDFCNGCRQCYEDCPYDGIVMRPRTDGAPFAEEAVVKADGCARCGACVGACNSGAIEMDGLSLRTLQPAIEERIRALPSGGVRVLVLSCQASAGGQAGAIDGLAGVANITVPCIATVHPFLAEYGLLAGADGVLLVGCPAEGGVYRLGNQWMEQRLEGSRHPRLRSTSVWEVNPSEGNGIFTLGAGAGEIAALRALIREIASKSDPGKHEMRGTG